MTKPMVEIAEQIHRDEPPWGRQTRDYRVPLLRDHITDVLKDHGQDTQARAWRVQTSESTTYALLLVWALLYVDLAVR